MHTMTRRCGLEDPDAFATSAPPSVVESPAGGEHATAWHNNRSGRTTRMLLRALCALEAGYTVEVVAADRERAMILHRRLDELARRARITGGPVCVTYPGAAASPTPDALFVDHCVAEAIEQDLGDFADPRPGYLAALEPDPAP